MKDTPLVLTTTIGQLATTAQSLLTYAEGCPIWTWSGPLGAGKTTLIKAVCACLGIRETVTSPTFALIQTYCLPDSRPVYHMDAYRIEREEEAHAMDYDFYFESGAYTFIEWPEKIQSFLPPHHLAIVLSLQDSFTRQLTAHKVMPT